MTLQFNGQTVHSHPYIPAERRGLYLYLKNTVLHVKQIRITCL